jgi:LPXTG-motif cell wall-anchored protein
MITLTDEEIQRRRYLTEKVYNNTLTPEEAKELINILEKEKKLAEEKNEILALIGIVFLIGMAMYFLSKKK